jgi:hypothetical protein
MKCHLRSVARTSLGALLCGSLLSLTACYRLDITQAPLYDDIMVKQPYKITDPRHPPAQNPQNMPKAYKKPVFNNELMRPSYMQHTPLPADIRDAQGILPPEKPEPGYPTLYGVPQNPDRAPVEQNMQMNRQQLEQDMNDSHSMQQQMMGGAPDMAPPPGIPSTPPPPPPPPPPGMMMNAPSYPSAPQGYPSAPSMPPQGMPSAPGMMSPPPFPGGMPAYPQGEPDEGAPGMVPPPTYQPGPSGALSPMTEKKTLKLAGHYAVVVDLLAEESTAPIPLPIPQAGDEPDWQPPLGMEGNESPQQMPEGPGFAAPVPPPPMAGTILPPQGPETQGMGTPQMAPPGWQPPAPDWEPPPGTAERMQPPRGWEPPGDMGQGMPPPPMQGADQQPYNSVFAPPPEMPPPFVQHMPQGAEAPFAPALGRRAPSENQLMERQRPAGQPAFQPPPTTPGGWAVHPATAPETAADAAIRTQPEGYVSRDNNPEPRDHTYNYVGLSGVPLQDIPKTKPYIDGLDEEVFGYVDQPPPPPGPEPTHEFGTPEIPEGAGHSHITEMHSDVGYADDPELFNEEPMLLNPFKYDNRPRVNHPDFTPQESPKPRPKRHEVGTRFTPAYRYKQPEITGPEHSSYYGYSYFKNVYSD